MKKTLVKVTAFGLLTAAIIVTPTSVFSADTKDTKPETGATEPAKAKSDIAPFRGKVSAIDKAAMTFTVGERTFQMNSETKITKNGKPATLGDAVVGDEVGGRFKKTEDGKLVALAVRFGPKPEAEAQPEKPAKEEKKAK